MKILFLAPEPFFEVRGTPMNVRQLLYFIGDMGHQVDPSLYTGIMTESLGFMSLNGVFKSRLS